MTTQEIHATYFSGSMLGSTVHSHNPHAIPAAPTIVSVMVRSIFAWPQSACLGRPLAECATAFAQGQSAIERV
jgi:hypothetical protein